MKNKLMILAMLAWQSASLAAVNMIKIDKAVDKKQIIKEKVSVKRSRQQVNIEGYVDSAYVRLVVEIDNKKRVTGHMWKENEEVMYVYGEIVNDIFHLYEPEGGYFTVIVP